MNDQIEYVVLYDDMAHDIDARHKAGVADLLEHVGSTTVHGQLFDIGKFPGLFKLGLHSYEAELFRIMSPDAVRLLDDFQNFDASGASESFFVRRRVVLPEYPVEAWIYYVSSDAIPDDAVEFADASWREYVQRTRPVAAPVVAAVQEDSTLSALSGSMLDTGVMGSVDGFDPVERPAHYANDPSGVECIEITRHRTYNIGAAIKYLWRAGLKNDAGMDPVEKQIEDLKKAIWYIEDEIQLLGGEKRHK